MAETCATNFPTLVSYSTLTVIVSICNRLDVLMEAGVEIVFFPTSEEIERSRKFDLLWYKHFQPYTNVFRSS